MFFVLTFDYSLYFKTNKVNECYFPFEISISLIAKIFYLVLKSTVLLHGGSRNDRFGGYPS